MFGIGIRGTGSNQAAVPIGQQVPNPIPLPPGQLPATFRTGTNLVGLESARYYQYDQTVGPGTHQYPIYSTALLDYLQASGVANVRFLFSWEAVQSNLGGTVPSSIGGNYAAYWFQLTNTIAGLLNRDIKVMIEPWQPNNTTHDTDICYRGAKFTQANFADFWSKMATAINTFSNNNQNICFGLINEPHFGAITGGDAVSNWYSYVQAAITGIRGTGATNTIYCPGWGFADSASFVSSGSAAQHLLLNDPLNNLGVTCHNYNGQIVSKGNPSSSTALRDACSSLLSWARSNNITKINIGELAIDNGNPNGSLSVAQNQWADWQSFCLANKDIITGWNWWATGENGWWETNDSSTGSLWDLIDGVTNSSFPSNPISNGSYSRNTGFTLNDGAQTDWVYVPSAYDGTHNTPMKLFVFLHGNGGNSSGDIYTVSGFSGQDWISMCPGGREKAAGFDHGWNTDMNGGVTIVMNAVAYMKTRFNISQVFLGGYSGGGDLTYYTIFQHSNTFAGAITENTNPWRDTPFSNSSAAAFAANSGGWKFHISHLYHTDDTEYPKSTTLTAFQTCASAGYSVNLTEKPGIHSDGNTDPDLRAFFPGWLEAGWVSPATSSGGYKDSTYMNLIKSTLGRF